jgi:RimJ/RimL family protein N-acetyltransferase
MLEPRVVETDRLLLRPWREDDEVELVRLMSDPGVGGGRDLPHARLVTFSRDSLRQWRANGFGPWAALVKATGRWIGRVGLDELGDRPEVGKTEVGFEEHRLDRIISVTAASHAAARRVMEKAGLIVRIPDRRFDLDE